MATTIKLREFQVEDFISVEHGTEKVTFTIFNGKVTVGEPGWAKQVELTPQQALDFANDLTRRAQEIIQQQGG